jgi:hypothetical protein
MDKLDWVFVGVLVIMLSTAAVERILGAQQLAKATLLWAVLLSCVFGVSVYFR